jgi:hypothetical protein
MPLRFLVALPVFLSVACGSSGGGGGRDAAVDADTDAADTGGPDAGDAAVDAADEAVDLSGESACCVGVASASNEGIRVVYVGLDSGRVRLGAGIDGSAVTGVASSIAFVGGELYFCESGEAADEVLRVSVASGDVSSTGAECVAITGDGTRLLVLTDDEIVRAYADEGDLIAGDEAATYEPGGLFSRIAATDTELLTAWHSTDAVARGPFAGPFEAVTLDGYDGAINGLDLLDDGRLVVAADIESGVLLFDGESGELLSSVVPVDEVLIRAIDCGSGPTYCPGP